MDTALYDGAGWPPDVLRRLALDELTPTVLMGAAITTVRLALQELEARRPEDIGPYGGDGLNSAIKLLNSVEDPETE